MQDGGMKDEEVTVNVIDDAKEDPASSQRIPKCARCRCHGINNELKGHKEKCQFKDCECRLCLMVVERQKITAIRVAHLRHQRKIDKQRAKKFYSAYPPLTEEEDYVLSNYMDGENARRHRIYMQDRYRYLNGRPYSAPSLRQSHYEAPYSSYGRYSESYHPRTAAYNGIPSPRATVCTQSCCSDKKEHKAQTRGYVENEARREPFPYSRTRVGERVRHDDKVETTAEKFNHEKRNHDNKEEINDNNNSDERNMTSKDALRRDVFIKVKCWEVLTVMFPDFDIKLIKYASEKARYNIQLAVEYLLEMKKQIREGDHATMAYAKYKQREEPIKTCPCCCTKPVPDNTVKTERSHQFEDDIDRPPLERIYKKTEC